MQWIYGTYETGNAIGRTVVRDVCLGRSRSRLNPIATIRGENAFRPMAKGGCPALDEEVRTPRLTQIPAPAPVRYLPPAVVRRD